MSESAPRLLADESLHEFPTQLADVDSGETGLIYIEVEAGMAYGDTRLTDDDGTQYACLEFVSVQDGRRQGKGSYLLKAFAREAALRNALRLDVVVVNPILMRSLIRMVGAQHIRIEQAAPATDIGQHEAALHSAVAEASNVSIDLTNASVQESLGLTRR